MIVAQIQNLQVVCVCVCVCVCACVRVAGIFLDTFLCPHTGQNTQSKIEFSKLNLNFLLFHRLG